MLTPKEILKYNRQIILPEIGIEGQIGLKRAKILVIGAGGLGCPISEYLVSSGVGTIGIIDFDAIALHNLPRQILYKEKDVNKLKTHIAYNYLTEKNTELQCLLFNDRLTDDNADRVIQTFDIIIDASDNFATRYLVNDTCVRLNKPLVYGSILKFEGQISVFNHKGSKNLRDIFPTPPNPEDVPNCDQNGVLSTLPGIVGTIMANEAIKLCTGLPVLSNQLLILDVMNWQFHKINF